MSFHRRLPAQSPTPASPLITWLTGYVEQKATPPPLTLVDRLPSPSLPASPSLELEPRITAPPDSPLKDGHSLHAHASQDQTLVQSLPELLEAIRSNAQTQSEISGNQEALMDMVRDIFDRVEALATVSAASPVARERQFSTLEDISDDDFDLNFIPELEQKRRNLRVALTSAEDSLLLRLVKEYGEEWVKVTKEFQIQEPVNLAPPSR
ncbi:hypothetical protein P152DRAFT_447556 [Eremomyces bilateralis CBS 781.70]|uniref:Uncharacterized protein n=1 Tax=Eremomyces bilateralis CBS 781.70 TaxID=1392243 RepID=A0A6G1G7Z9_9PEZI|nr:uncharacterized protein P152DRAFT_447556 [Eremomyces bilateralis CBS 781.70]KAF1814154.1 hypothetical protein P152DRAFT_447556 [Eremomyces bilateralis CBS 781.70]